jgi:hypothetical protein
MSGDPNSTPKGGRAQLLSWPLVVSILTHLRGALFRNPELFGHKIFTRLNTQEYIKPNRHTPPLARRRAKGRVCLRGYFPLRNAPYCAGLFSAFLTAATGFGFQKSGSAFTHASGG